MSRGCGAPLSRRARRRGRGLVMDFCFSFLAAPRRRSLQRRRDEGDGCSGAAAAGLLGLAAGWRIRRALLGVRPDGGSSRASPRRRQPEVRDLVIEIEPRGFPRPASHSDMWALELLLVVHKASGRWGSLDLGCAGRRPSSSSSIGVGDGRRSWPDVAVNPKDLVVFLFFFRCFLAISLALRILLDRIPWVCTFAVLLMSMN